MYSEFEIRTIPLSLKSSRKKVEDFLALHGLRLDSVDYYAGIFRLEEDTILACGGLKDNIIKCIAVDDELKGTGLSNRLVSHLINTAFERNFTSVRVFTKPKNLDIFVSLGFELIASCNNAVLLENDTKKLKSYCNYLQEENNKATANLLQTQNTDKSCTNGCIVMNCNPFTKGHRWLIEQATRMVDTLYIIPVKEDVSEFSYAERKMMIEIGTKDIENVHVTEGSDYSISQLTFPTYFLKDLNDAADTHISLDLDVFVKFIAPSLNITKRFVGSEPTDKLTARYNELMHQILEPQGIEVVEIKRKEIATQNNDTSTLPISASVLRNHIKNFSLIKASKLAYKTSVPFIISHLATNALQQELDTTPKPGLVDRHDNGAHKDMDHALMSKSIKVLQPYFTQLALLGCHNDLPFLRDIISIGLEAENAMFKATNGVNTYKGALFSMGLSVLSASHLMYLYDNVTPQTLQDCISILASRFDQPENTHGDKVLQQHKIKGALYNAVDGYKELFSSWLPFYNTEKQDMYCLHKLLLLIMTTLEDTNIYYRCGKETVEKVKQSAKALLKDFDVYKLEQMNKEFIKENISPGGAADMLSLTIFISSVTS